jgi:fructose-1,6-bisphosphatase/inositol monophosphatase family enzyme
MDFRKLADIAISAALSAGEIIKRYKDEEVEVEEKNAGSSRFSEVVTKVDKACEAEILTQLRPSCKEYDLALLSEETDDDGSRLEKEYFWCVDPIDGTLAFINKEPGFSVSIALVAKDGTPCIGVVFDPSSGVLYHAVKDRGAFKNREPWDVRRDDDRLTYVTDRTLEETPRAGEIKELLDEYVQRFGLSGIREMSGGGAVLNAIRVFENGPACMMKFPKKETGGGCIWDYAATACICLELGLQATNFEGGRLDLNRPDGVFMNHEGVYYSNLPKGRKSP